jgi:precorrin-6B methylase 2
VRTLRESCFQKSRANNSIPHYDLHHHEIKQAKSSSTLSPPLSPPLSLAGAGSGLLSILAVRTAENVQVTAIEANPELAELGKETVRVNGLEGRIKVRWGICSDKVLAL